MKKINCVFCEIIEKKEVHAIEQNETCIAFLDKNPVSKGHILVCTKDHFEVFHQIEKQKIKLDLINLISSVTLLLSEKISVDYNIYQANGINAEQSINHVHFHIIPRFHNDNVNIELPTDKDINIIETIDSIK